MLHCLTALDGIVDITNVIEMAQSNVMLISIVKLGCAGVNLFFLFFAPKHRLWVLFRTSSPQSMV